MYSFIKWAAAVKVVDGRQIEHVSFPSFVKEFEIHDKDDAIMLELLESPRLKLSRRDHTTAMTMQKSNEVLVKEEGALQGHASGRGSLGYCIGLLAITRLDSFCLSHINCPSMTGCIVFWMTVCNAQLILCVGGIEDMPTVQATYYNHHRFGERQRGRDSVGEVKKIQAGRRRA